VAERLRARSVDRPSGERGRGHRGVIDDAVNDHVYDVLLDLDGVSCDLGDLPGELVFAGEVLFAAVNADVMGDGHYTPSGSVERESRMPVRALYR
jgi:hypothetical protein